MNKHDVVTFRSLIDGTHKLRDIPSLTFRTKRADGKFVDQYVQLSHVTYEQLLDTKMADSLWEFDQGEWTPCFHFSPTNTLTYEELFAMEPYLNPFSEIDGILWVTPKEFVREQYYTLADGHIVNPRGYKYELPVFDKDTGTFDSDYELPVSGACDYCDRHSNDLKSHKSLRLCASCHGEI